MIAQGSELLWRLFGSMLMFWINDCKTWKRHQITAHCDASELMLLLLICENANVL